MRKHFYAFYKIGGRRAVVENLLVKIVLLVKQIFFLQGNFLLFTQFNDLLKLNLVCVNWQVFSLGKTKVSSSPPLKKVSFDEMTSWHTFFKRSPASCLH